MIFRNVMLTIGSIEDNHGKLKPATACKRNTCRGYRRNLTRIIYRRQRNASRQEWKSDTEATRRRNYHLYI